MFSQKMMNRGGDLVVAVVVPSGDGGEQFGDVW